MHRAAPKQAFALASTEEEELRCGSMFNATTKMQLMISKAKTDSNIEWVFHMVHDFRTAGFLTQDYPRCGDCPVLARAFFDVDSGQA